MDSKKVKTVITTKPASDSTGKTKGVVMEDDRAALVKPSRMPSYIQARTIAVDEEKKEKEILKKSGADKLVVLNTKK